MCTVLLEQGYKDTALKLIGEQLVFLTDILERQLCLVPHWSP